MAVVAHDVSTGEFFAFGATIEESFRKALAVAVLAIGYLGSAILGLVGLARRRMLGIAWILAWMPLYWFMLSVAAWRALYLFFRAPYQWEKTQHGLARTSLRGADRTSVRPAGRSMRGRVFMDEGRIRP